MRDFIAVVYELKGYISQDTKVKVLDKDVADALQISQMNFATLKRRNSTPYKHILEYCKKENLCCNKVFFKS